MQCADSISGLVERARHICSVDETAEYLANIQESAQTILFCTSHQKRIIDDVLVVSKIDSELLTITPIPVQPEIVVGQAMQIFEAELADAKIDFGYTLEKSYNVSWAHCDPTRLTQILINLLTNAIKFTRTSATRSIHVTVGAADSGPPPNLNGLQWSPKQGKPTYYQCSDDEVFLTFAVRDTGAGMSMEGMSRLFNRFTQASPMTHVQVSMNSPFTILLTDDISNKVRRIRVGSLHIKRIDRVARRYDWRRISRRPREYVVFFLVMWLQGLTI